MFKTLLNLENILESTEKIEAYTSSFSCFEDFYASDVYFDAVMMKSELIKTGRKEAGNNA